MILKAPAKKSTANQRYDVISYWLLLIVTLVVLLAVCEILSRTEVENCHFRLSSILIVDPRGRTPSNIINVNHTSLNNTLG